MIDREKVIANLTRCQHCLCNECDLEHASHYVWDCEVQDQLINDALELLKTQEPRVLTLEEVQNDCPDYVYLEWLNCCVCCIKDEGESNESVGYFAYGIEGYYYQFLWDTYGTKWRCWSTKPTDDQRKALKWDE